MEEKTTKSMNLALERPTERLYVLIPTEMERLLNEKAKEMIDSGKAYSKLQEFVKATQEA